MKPRKTVLLVEDDEQMRKTTSTVLNLHRYDVIEAEDGKAALKMMGRINPDLILCDVDMPGANGMDVLDAFRADPDKSSTPFVFVSGQNQREQVRNGMNRGADDYLTKPFTIKELLSSIESGLQKFGRRRERWQKVEETLREREFQILSHEVRTPLTGIVGGVDLMIWKNSREAKQEDDVVPQIVKDSTDRLHETLSRYLMFLELKSGKNPALLQDKAMTVVDDLLKETAEALAKKCKREGDLKIGALVTYRTTKGELIRKIISELVTNAFNFSDPGTEVKVTLLKRGSWDAINITDMGDGMTPEEIVKIAPFVQFPRKGREQHGLGVGLALARALALYAGGNLTITPNQPKGLSVDLILGNASA